MRDCVINIEVTEKLLRKNEALLTFRSAAVLSTAFETPGLIDFDVREALESLIRTYRTLQSGVYYESLPQNPLAAGIHRGVQEGLGEYRRDCTPEVARGTRDDDRPIVEVHAIPPQ